MTIEQQPSDAELISAVRGGDSTAYGELFSRHVESARRLARQLASAGDVEDLVSEAFAKVLTIVQRGGGPDLAFRAYLLTAVRSLYVDTVRGTTRLRPVDDFAPFDDGVPFRDTAVEGFENQAAARAFATLPERWQLVLWHTEVEGQKPAEVAKLLGMSANSVSALAYRAREGLRQAFLNMHAQDAEDDACAWTQDNLGAYIRNAASKRDEVKVRAHIDECRRCMGIYLELSEVNTNLSGIIGPMVLGSAAAGYIAVSAAAAHGGLVGVLGRAGDIVGNHTVEPRPGRGRGRDRADHRPGARSPRPVAGGGSPGRRSARGQLRRRPPRSPTTARRSVRTARRSRRGKCPTHHRPMIRPSPRARRCSPARRLAVPATRRRSPGQAGRDDLGAADAHRPGAAPEVDAEVSAEETVLEPNLKRVELEVSGLAEEGGVLEITTSNNEQVDIEGDCPERVCTVAPGTTILNFAVDGLEIDEFTMVYFNVTPVG